MTSALPPPRSGWIAFLAHLLFILAAWSVFIKYIFPIAFALIEGVPLTSYIFWDFWPIAHVWLGWALLARPGYTRWLAIVMSVVEKVSMSRSARVLMEGSIHVPLDRSGRKE